MMQHAHLELTDLTGTTEGWFHDLPAPVHRSSAGISLLDRLCEAAHRQKSDVSFNYYYTLWGDPGQPTFLYLADTPCLDAWHRHEAEWTRIAQSSQILSVQSVTAIMKEVNDRLMRAEFAQLDLELASLSINRMGPDGISAVARITAAARDKLSSWHQFVDTADRYLAKHFPESRALEGLPSALGRQSVSAREFGGRSDHEASQRGFSLGDAVRQWLGM